MAAKSAKRIIVSLDADVTDPNESKKSLLQPYIAANQAYAEQTGGGVLFDINVTTETDLDTGEKFALIQVSRWNAQPSGGRKPEIVREYVFEDAVGNKLRSKDVLKQERDRLQQYKHDKLDAALHAKKMTLATESRISKAVNRIDLVLPSDEAAYIERLIAEDDELTSLENEVIENVTVEIEAKKNVV